MKKLKSFILLMIKAILFYSTAIASVIFLGAADGIYNKGLESFLTYLFILSVLIFFCYALITEKDFDKITFNILGKTGDGKSIPPDPLDKMM